MAAMQANGIGEELAKRAEIARIQRELDILPIHLEMVCPDEDKIVPEEQRARFLKALTDDWALLDDLGNVIPWPPGTKVRATVAVTPRGREADALKQHIDNLFDVRPDGVRRDPRALERARANAG